jgi:hypothetical protein
MSAIANKTVRAVLVEFMNLSLGVERFFRGPLRDDFELARCAAVVLNDLRMLSVI